MELKYTDKAISMNKMEFKLYLYGIEMGSPGDDEKQHRRFKLYLYGIEIAADDLAIRLVWVQIVPLWN